MTDSLALMAVKMINQLTNEQLEGLTLLLMCNSYMNKRYDSLIKTEWKTDIE